MIAIATIIIYNSLWKYPAPSYCRGDLISKALTEPQSISAMLASSTQSLS